MTRLQPRNEALQRRDAPAREFRPRQHARPRIEHLHRLGAGLDLKAEIIGRGIGEAVDQGAEQFWLAIGEQPRRRLVRRAAPGDHVAGHRPRRAAEADERRLGRQRGLDARDRLEHRRQPRPIRGFVELFEILAVGDGVEPRPLAGLEADALPESVGQHEDVGEQDRRVEAEAPNRLQGRLDGEPRRVAKIEERGCRRAQLPIFRQIASGLPHQPHRRAFLALAGERGEEGFGHGRIPVSPDCSRETRSEARGARDSTRAGDFSALRAKSGPPPRRRRAATPQAFLPIYASSPTIYISKMYL